MDSHGSCFGPFAALARVGSGDGVDDDVALHRGEFGGGVGPEQQLRQPILPLVPAALVALDARSGKAG